MLARWRPLGSLSHPKIHRPMKVASKKNAMRPSKASGAPNTSPTKREYDDQFIPNWNSCTMPVTTPIAKLMRKILPKKRVRWSHFTLPVRNHAVWKIETVSAIPRVRGTNRKWYRVVRPNCQRASSSGSSQSMGFPPGHGRLAAHGTQERGALRGLRAGLPPRRDMWSDHTTRWCATNLETATGGALGDHDSGDDRDAACPR